MKRHVMAVALAILALMAVWALAVALWPRLPERFPVHYDIRGVPDRWDTRDPLSWYALPLIDTVLSALLLLVGAFIPGFAARWPELVNVPQKEKFVRLPPEARARALRPAQSMLAVLVFLMNGLFVYLVWGSWAVATGQRSTLGAWIMIPFFAGVIGLLVWGTLALRAAILAESGPEGR
jgi:ABC-type Na+ efflux pump permease subunit